MSINFKMFIHGKCIQVQRRKNECSVLIIASWTGI